MTKALIDRIKIGCFGLDPIDPLRVLLDEVIEALAQPEQEPVLWMMPDGKTANKWALQFYSGQVGKPLYTTPPQRTWVGLTDEEIEIIYAECNVWDKFEYERMLEAKLKEKNFD